MKNSYVKTRWVDNKTPINSANLNKIENAITDLYDNALSPSEIIQGNGISIEVTKDRQLQISITGDLVISNTCVGFEVIKDRDLDIEGLERDVLYYVTDPLKGDITKVLLNGKALFEKKESNSDEESSPVLISETCTGFEIVSDSNFKVEESKSSVLYYIINSLTGKLLKVVFNKVIVFEVIPPVTSNTCSGFEVYKEDELPETQEIGKLYFVLDSEGKLSKIKLNGAVLFEIPKENN